MTVKSYGAAKAIGQGKSFDFKVGEEVFAVPLPVPGMALLDLTAGAESEGAAAVAAFGQFMANSMGDEDFQRFHKVSMTARLEIEEIIEIVKDLLEASTGVPTQPQPASPGSSSNTGTGSAAAVTEKA